MTKDYEIYEPYKYWDPFIERDATSLVDQSTSQPEDREKKKKNQKEKYNYKLSA